MRAYRCCRSPGLIPYSLAQIRQILQAWMPTIHLLLWYKVRIPIYIPSPPSSSQVCLCRDLLFGYRICVFKNVGFCCSFCRRHLFSFPKDVEKMVGREICYDIYRRDYIVIKVNLRVEGAWIRRLDSYFRQCNAATDGSLFETGIAQGLRVISSSKLLWCFDCGASLRNTRHAPCLWNTLSSYNNLKWTSFLFCASFQICS